MLSTSTCSSLGRAVADHLFTTYKLTRLEDVGCCGDGGNAKGEMAAQVVGSGASEEALNGAVEPECWKGRVSVSVAGRLLEKGADPSWLSPTGDAAHEQASKQVEDC
ncbi:hypothetical protein MK139_01080 [bacterium]|nr:hypothetical protein [bacterium]